MKLRNGVTLIELLICVAILSISSATLFNLAIFSVRHHHEHDYTGNQLQHIRLLFQKLEKYKLERKSLRKIPDGIQFESTENISEKWFLKDYILYFEDTSGIQPWVEGITCFEVKDDDGLQVLTIKTMALPEYGKSEIIYDYAFRSELSDDE